MSLIRVSRAITEKTAKHWGDGTASDACTRRVRQLREAGYQVTRDGDTITWSVERDSYVEATSLTFLDEEMPGQTDALDMLEEK